MSVSLKQQLTMLLSPVILLILPQKFDTPQKFFYPICLIFTSAFHRFFPSVSMKSGYSDVFCLIMLFFDKSLSALQFHFRVSPC